MTPRRPRLRLALQGLGLSLAGWGVLALCVLLLDGRLPHGRPGLPQHGIRPLSTEGAWESFATAVVLVESLWLRGWLMLRRTRVWTWLGASIIAVDLLFAAVYLYAIVNQMWPAVGGWSDEVRLGRWLVTLTASNLIRWTLIAVNLWGIAELLRDDAARPSPSSGQ